MFEETVVDNGSDKNRWGNILLNLMGPVGEDICNTFPLARLKSQLDVDVLLEKFDAQYISWTRKKQPRENLEEYINNLQLIVEEYSLDSGEDLSKEKILTEIDKDQFTNAAKSILPTFTVSSNVQKVITIVQTLKCQSKY